MRTLDLHGVKHSDVKTVVDAFIWIAMNNQVHYVKIITGKSGDMIRIVKECLSEYDFIPKINEITGVMYVEINTLI